jgi:protein-arginine kinase activator protein McsA
MRCERCGVELTNKIIKINDVPYCENCARLMGYGRFLRSPEEMLGSAFSPLDEIASSIMQMNELDFGNSALSCPKCGMTLRDFEKKGRLGCIECYNTFNDYIVKEMFKQQGESTYGGRMPGQTAELNSAGEDILPGKTADEGALEAPAKEEPKDGEKPAEAKAEDSADLKAQALDKLS